MDVTQVVAPITATTCDALVGVALVPQETRTCTFTIFHEFMAADVDDGFIDDRVTVVGQDNDGTVTETADAQVAVIDLLPEITVVKTANPTIVDETGPGQTRPVTYTVDITNDTAEPVRIEAITDSVDGGPAVPWAGPAPRWWAPGSRRRPAPAAPSSAPCRARPAPRWSTSSG
jgi:hypothetical protein